MAFDSGLSAIKVYRRTRFALRIANPCSSTDVESTVPEDVHAEETYGHVRCCCHAINLKRRRRAALGGVMQTLQTQNAAQQG
jgi:hypothetical protein